MAAKRDRPFSQFNFLVDIGNGTDSVEAGFQEVGGLGMEITVAEYRAGNEKENAPIKVTGTHKVPDVTLKRGVIGAEDLYEWLGQVQKGKQSEAHRQVEIQLLNEERDTGNPAVTWILSKARPIKYTGPALNGKGTDVAIEELVLACEKVEIQT
jgi:phage tail-like protein